MCLLVIGTNHIGPHTRNDLFWFAVQSDLTLRLVTRSVNAHTNTVCTVLFNKDATRLVSAAQDAVTKVWSSQDQVVLMRLEDPRSSQVWAAEFIFENILALGTEFGVIDVWDLETGLSIHRHKQHLLWISDIMLHQQNVLISSSIDQTIKLSEYPTFVVLHVFEVTDMPIRLLLNESMLYASVYNQGVWRYDLEARDETGVLVLPHNDYCYSVHITQGHHPQGLLRMAFVD